MRFYPMHTLATLLAALTCGMAATAHAKIVFESKQPQQEEPAPSHCDSYTGPAGVVLHHFRGVLHEHTKYSDGNVKSMPGDVFRAGRDNGLDFANSSDHSDVLNRLLPISVGDGCIESPSDMAGCLVPDNGDLNRWKASGQQAAMSTTADFLAIRGFEWTNDRLGHINVYFSSNFLNAKLDPEYLTSQGAKRFYQWLQRDPGQETLAGVGMAGGGGDGLAVFNHPGDKCLLGTEDAACNWNQFAYVPGADQQMVGMELFNGGRDPAFPDYYMQALDAGWHVGAVGAEDRHNTTWAQPQYPKTVILAETLTPQGFKEAMLARRMYALVSNKPGEDMRISLDAEGHPMGSRLRCDAGARVVISVSVTLRSGEAFNGLLRLYDHANPDVPFAAGGYGEPLATAAGDSLHHELTVPDQGERWFFVRIDDPSGQSLAYTSPVWIAPR